MSSTGDRYNAYSQGSSGWSIMRKEEFQEHDIWGVPWESKEMDSHSTAHNSTNSSTMFSRPQTTTAARMIPNSITTNPINDPRNFHQSSAPVNVPDWQKIYGENSSGYVSGGMMNKSSWESDDEDEDDDEKIVVPPHEYWTARRQARSQISSFSVYEGAGRTLKGRDLSNVRNAVLTKTGFLE